MIWIKFKVIIVSFCQKSQNRFHGKHFASENTPLKKLKVLTKKKHPEATAMRALWEQQARNYLK